MVALTSSVHLLVLLVANQAWNTLTFSVAFVLPTSSTIQQPRSSSSVFLFRSLFSSGIVISNNPQDNDNESRNSATIIPSSQQYLESEDILSVKVKPKILIHERDFFRQSARLEAWNNYVLCSVLCTSICYNALQSYHLDDSHTESFIYTTVVLSLIRLAAGLSVVCGLYSTMVFSISILYGYTALGMERDPQYDDFLKGTQDLRRKAFTAFSSALGFFALLVALVLTEKLPLVLHLPVGVLLIGALFVGVQDWTKLVDSAGPIYSDD